jgi:two-component system chemotaxis response regulator CheY
VKTLIVDDDFSSRLLLQRFLAELGETNVASEGQEAVSAVRAALAMNAPYDLICLDILMPGLDGQQALEAIRALEAGAEGGQPSKRARVVVTTALGGDALDAVREQADAYLFKPVRKERLIETVRQLGLG